MEGPTAIARGGFTVGPDRHKSFELGIVLEDAPIDAAESRGAEVSAKLIDGDFGVGYDFEVHVKVPVVKDRLRLVAARQLHAGMRGSGRCPANLGECGANERDSDDLAGTPGRSHGDQRGVMHDVQSVDVLRAGVRSRG
jgi:hypothetical protein